MYWTLSEFLYRGVANACCAPAFQRGISRAFSTTSQTACRDSANIRTAARALARERDVLMAVSSSGTSANIVDAARTALEIGMDLVTFSAFSADNRLHKLQSTLSFHTPTDIYGHAELAHAALIHAAVDICSRWEEER